MLLIDLQVQQRERKNAYLIEDCSSSSEDEDGHNRLGKMENRRTRRINRRASRGGGNIFVARKRMLLEGRKSPLEKENARRLAKLGHGGCPACMTNPCKHVPVVNVEVGVVFCISYDRDTPQL